MHMGWFCVIYTLLLIINVKNVKLYILYILYLLSMHSCNCVDVTSSLCLKMVCSVLLLS